jgi:hypothetical protein
MLRKVLEEPDPSDPSKTPADRLVEAILRQAERGNWHFTKMIWDRIDGPIPRPAVAVSINNNTGPTYILEGDEWGRLQADSGAPTRTSR